MPKAPLNPNDPPSQEPVSSLAGDVGPTGDGGDRDHPHVPGQNEDTPLPHGENNVLPASVEQNLEEEPGAVEDDDRPKIPAVALEIAIQAVRRYESNGERPTISRDNLAADLSVTIRPDMDGPGFVLTTIEGYNAHQLAKTSNDRADDAVRNAEARKSGIQKHLAQLKEDFTVVKEDHARGLRTDHELAISKANYESNVSHVKAPLKAEQAIIDEKPETRRAPKPVETRIVISAKTVEELLKTVTVA